jgi:hypothetical protein
MEFNDLKTTVAAAKRGVRLASMRLASARAVLAKLRAIEMKHRSLLLPAEPTRAQSSSHPQAASRTDHR